MQSGKTRRTEKKIKNKLSRHAPIVAQGSLDLESNILPAHRRVHLGGCSAGLRDEVDVAGAGVHDHDGLHEEEEALDDQALEELDVSRCVVAKREDGRTRGGE